MSAARQDVGAGLGGTDFFSGLDLSHPEIDACEENGVSLAMQLVLICCPCSLPHDSGPKRLLLFVYLVLFIGSIAAGDDQVASETAKNASAVWATI